MTLPESQRGAGRGVAIVGLFRAEIGIGQSARRSAQCLEAVHYPVTRHLVPMLPGTFENNVEVPGLLTKPPGAGDVVIHLNPPDFNVVAPRYFCKGDDEYRRIAYWHWELPLFPRAWTGALNLADEIWTPSRFGVDMFAAATTMPVRRIPHAVPVNDISRDEARAALGLPLDRFLFLVICDTNSFPARKNPGGAIRAFLDAFPDERKDSPQLLLKMHGNRNRSPALESLLRLARNNPRIKLIDEVLKEGRMRELQAACDCYVSVHRSECFGLNIAECMAAGRLVIVTDFSGNTDFTHAGNAILIPHVARNVRPHEYPAVQGQWWAEPDHDATVEAMRWAVGNPAAAQQLAGQARQDMSTNYSFQKIGEVTVKALNAE
jgi:glycosyltransferase involved in cell wall biosynthesis